MVIPGISDEKIRMEVLSRTDLDRRTLNETICFIENKEKTVHVMSSSSASQAEGSNSAAVHQKDKCQPDTSIANKLNLIANCTNYGKEIMKFKMRYGKPR